MIRELTFLLSLALAGAPQPGTLAKSKLPDCRKVIVQDSERRSFDDGNSFTLDVDGDGKPDTITPRTYTLKASRKGSRITPNQREIHWIAFDMETSRGPRLQKPFFQYDYGTDEADYWVYAFVPCSINADERPELLFYSGDDTSVETIILVNKGNAFKVHSRKQRKVDF
jgi:hypothetical protein